MSCLILHGRRRFFEMQKWRHLRCAVQNASPFSSAATLSRKGHNFTASTYLVESLGHNFKTWPVFLALSDKNIAGSVKTFLELGFSRDEFVMIVKRFPNCIGLSVETVKRKTELLLNEMNWPLKAVVSNPSVLGYSLEKRIIPRCNVIKALRSKGFIRSELPPVMSVLACTNEMFVKRYVMKHDDEQIVAELMTIFTRVHLST